jgi:SOS-response transcriptional repressor LexA
VVNRRPEHLTEREEEILRVIRRSIQDRGETMSLREPAREIGMRSTASVACHLANLEERGALMRNGRGAGAGTRHGRAVAHLPHGLRHRRGRRDRHFAC